MFLYDFGGMDNKRHEQFIGRGNGLIQTTIKNWLNKVKNVVARVPVIPAKANNDEENFRKLENSQKHNPGCHRPAALSQIGSDET